MKEGTSGYRTYIKKHKMILILGVAISVTTFLLTSYNMVDKTYTASFGVKLENSAYFGVKYDLRSFPIKISTSIGPRIEKERYDNLISDYSQVLLSKSFVEAINKKFKIKINIKYFSDNVNIIKHSGFDGFDVTFKDLNPKIAREMGGALTKELINSTKKLSKNIKATMIGDPIVLSSFKTKFVMQFSVLIAILSLSVGLIVLLFAYIFEKVLFGIGVLKPEFVVERKPIVELFFARQEFDNTISNTDEILQYFVRDKSKILVLSANQSSVYKSLIAQNIACDFSSKGYNTLLIKADTVDHFLDGKSFLSEMEIFQKRKDEKDFELWTADFKKDKENDFLTALKVKSNSCEIKTIPDIINKFADFFDILVLDTVYPDKESLNKSLNKFSGLLMEVDRLGCDLKLSKIA